MLTLTTQRGQDGLAAIAKNPAGCLAGFDYDGTVAPIVPDPARAAAHPGVIRALRQLASTVGTVAIITGRPAKVAVELAGFAGIEGLESMIVVGHYGLERWDAESGRLTETTPPPGLDVVRDELPDLLAEIGLAEADIEDKDLSVAVHVRRMANPGAAYSTMVVPLTELAARTGLAAEPGRMVVELRPPGMDKGQALRALVGERAATSVIFAGDDLGDLTAYDEVDRLRQEGVPGLLVCSGSDEVTELAERADVVVDGPSGVAHFLDDLLAAVNA